MSTPHLRVESGRRLLQTGPMTTDASHLDATGLECPHVAIAVKRRLSSMPQGALLIVTATDPLSVLDVPAMAAEHGHKVIEVRTPAEGPVFVIEAGLPQSGKDGWPRVGQ